MIIFAILAIISGDGRRDFYDVLGLKHDCTDREIEKSFQKLSRKYHPDKNKGDVKAAEKFTDINDAYSTLRDTEKRRVFDLWGEQGVHIYESPISAIDPKTGLPNAVDDDSFSSQVKRKGKTMRVTYPVDLLDFYEGRVYNLSITRRVMCRCPEAGFYCMKCRGRPTIQENLTLTLVIEKGSDEGSVALFKGAGDVSEVNSAGDVEVVIVSRSNPIFKRDGSNLHMNVTISLREALLGFTQKIKHIDGSELKIESTELLGSGKTLVIKGKGLPKYLYPGEFGDIIVKPRIIWPKTLSAEKKNQLVQALGVSH